MNHSRGYFQTLTPIVGPVPIPTLEFVVPTHHLSYCFLNFPFTFIFLGWRKTILVWVLRRQAGQGHRRWWLQVVSEWLMEQMGRCDGIDDVGSRAFFHPKATSTILLDILGWFLFWGFGLCPTVFWLWDLRFLLPGPL